jgi:hypothetical protein
MPTELYKSPPPKLRAIIRPRGAGKTSEIVDMLKKDARLCVLVATVQRQHQLEQNYSHLRGRVFSNPTAIKGLSFRGIVIDDIEESLPDLPLPLVAFTVTGNGA